MENELQARNRKLNDFSKFLSRRIDFIYQELETRWYFTIKNWRIRELEMIRDLWANDIDI